MSAGVGVRDVSVRDMLPGDIGAVAEIEATVAPEPWSVALFEGEFSVDPSTRHWLVAEADGVIVGFAGMMFVGLGDTAGGESVAEGHLMNIAVAPGMQRRGIAWQLCRHLMSYAAELGVDAVTLEVRVSNTGAIGLYRSFGFAPVGNRPGYYSNPDGSKEDGLIFWLHDNVARVARSESLR